MYETDQKSRHCLCIKRRTRLSFRNGNSNGSQWENQEIPQIIRARPRPGELKRWNGRNRWNDGKYCLYPFGGIPRRSNIYTFAIILLYYSLFIIVCCHLEGPLVLLRQWEKEEKQWQKRAYISIEKFNRSERPLFVTVAQYQL